VISLVTSEYFPEIAGELLLALCKQLNTLPTQLPSINVASTRLTVFSRKQLNQMIIQQQTAGVFVHKLNGLELPIFKGFLTRTQNSGPNYEND